MKILNLIVSLWILATLKATINSNLLLVVQTHHTLFTNYLGALSFLNREICGSFANFFIGILKHNLRLLLLIKAQVTAAIDIILTHL